MGNYPDNSELGTGGYSTSDSLTNVQSEGMADVDDLNMLGPMYESDKEEEDDDNDDEKKNGKR